MIEFKKQKKSLNGEIVVQGDKEISIFSVILSSIANGKSKLYGLLESQQILNLIDIMKQLGIDIYKENNYWVVNGQGINGLKEPINTIDVKKYTDTLYLLIGFLSSYEFKLFFKGDDCLSNINLNNILDIFKSLNVSFCCRNDNNLPFLMIGNNEEQLKYDVLEYNSILKNVLLLSCLNIEKDNIIKEKEKSRNHLEILMKYFGIIFEEHDIGNKENLSTKIGREISIKGYQNFGAKDISIPSDISFSSFIAILAILISSSDIILRNVLMNRYRDAFYRTLIDMGANITFINQKIICGEKVADINVKFGKLKDTIIPANRLNKMLFEFPMLILISALSRKNIEIQGIDIVKNKNINDYNFILNTLKELNVNCEEYNNSLKINGKSIDLSKEIKINDDVKNNNIILSFGLFGLFLSKSIKINKSIEDYFPNLLQFLQSININVK